MRLFVGLDVSSFDIKICFLDGKGKKLRSFTIENDPPGAQLRYTILDTARGQSIEEVPKHQHKRSLTLTERKLVRLADALLRNNQIYTAKEASTHEA